MEGDSYRNLNDRLQYVSDLQAGILYFRLGSVLVFKSFIV
jgi:hypothetical protein